jgi:hypothetical protein
MDFIFSNSVVVVGASRMEGKPGYIVLKNIREDFAISAVGAALGPVGSKLKAVVSSFLKWLQLKAPPFMRGIVREVLNTKCPLGDEVLGGSDPPECPSDDRCSPEQMRGTCELPRGNPRPSGWGGGQKNG